MKNTYKTYLLFFKVGENKCNSNERDFDGATSLHYAASQGHAAVIDWLMKEGGAKVTLDNLGGSPLHNAAESNQLQVSVFSVLPIIKRRFIHV